MQILARASLQQAADIHVLCDPDVKVLLVNREKELGNKFATFVCNGVETRLHLPEFRI